MAESYRKTIGSNVWHFCSNCATWPLESYIASVTPEQIGDEELCNECVARHNIGDCDNQMDLSSLRPRKCPVIVNGRECGLLLVPEAAAGRHVCAAGHRILVVPPADP